MTSTAIVGDITCTSITSSFATSKSLITTKIGASSAYPTFSLNNSSVFVGNLSGSGASIASGSSLTVVGNSAGNQLLSSASDTVIVGYACAANITSSSRSIYMGTLTGLGTTSANNNVYIGHNAAYQYSGGDNVCIGYQAGASSLMSSTAATRVVCLGSDSKASGDDSISIGYNSNVTANNAIAIGSGSDATVADSIGIGLNANASASAAICIGSGSAASATDGIAIGKNSLASAASSIAIGSGVTSSTASRITIGTSSQHVYIGGKLRSNTTGNGLTIEQDTPGSAWLTMQASFSGGPSIITIPRATSTVGTIVVTAQTVPVIASQIQWIEVKALGKRTGGSAGSVSDSAYFRVTGLYYNNAGTVSLIGSVIKEFIPATTSWNVNLTISTTNVLVEVSGATNVNIDWQVVTSTWNMG
uniref:Adhesin YadA n=1 Tax=Clandestinovirus TaxID=2831644 RepID=A0A8F8PK27_9VIRU|nr:adhesin YadA [Clandestinovirus]